MFAVFLFLKILLIILLIFIAIIILALTIPYNYNILYSITSEVYGFAEVKAFGGLIKVRHEKLKEESNIKVYIIKICVYSRKLEAMSLIKYEEKTPTKEKSSINIKGITVKFIKRVISYIYEIGGLIKPKVFNITGTYGISDPSVTGFIAAVVPIVQVIFSFVNLELYPDFSEELLDVQVKCKGSISIFLILFRTMIFLLNKNVRKVIFRNNKKSSKSVC